jgi:hypothetical protein
MISHTRFEKLPGLPPYGPLARAFGGPQHSEDLVVRFRTMTGETWVGNSIEAMAVPAASPGQITGCRLSERSGLRGHS